MSKIGRLPITIKPGVTVTISGSIVTIKGPKGESMQKIPSGISATLENDVLVLKKDNLEDTQIDAMYGMIRALIANDVKGVETGFEKKLELSGVGYRAQMQGTDLVLSLGFSHPVKYKPAPGIAINIAENVITISGANKALVGDTAAKIRAIRPPEPYKGKGIKYYKERIRRKAGKAAKAVGTK